ncbi:nitroreductase family protein [Fulvivirgaceae bacterium BMA12]|uniref:Nitroreductase family protein n=1 Tax=Agaribacillus aureus TaxID=3051825 RepID=A0ABT8LDS4_9BACT|nr:nitroreductase family protein [Fulvivirgaceae bacterium BMA12]
MKWDLSMQDFIEKLIEYAAKAPSGHNTQPWKFAYYKNIVKIFPDYSRSLPVVDEDNHALFISLGCAVENLIVAAGHFGYLAKVDYFPSYENNECIRVKLEEGTIDPDNRLFEAIDKRQSTRSQYNGRNIPAEDVSALLSTLHYEGVKSLIFNKKQEIIPLIEFVRQGSSKQFSNKTFKNELLSWVRFNAKAAEATCDGLRSATMGSPAVPSWLGKLIITLLTPSGEAKRAEKLIKSAAALMIFIAEADDKRNWINLGRTFERVALTATALGIKHSHLNMPCEEVEIRNKLARYLGLSNKQQPLLLIRLGYADFMPYSFRRPLNRIIYKEKSLDNPELKEPLKASTSDDS